MCTAVAVVLSDIPDALFEAHALGRRVHRRTEKGAPEVRFDWRDAEPMLPVLDGGGLRIVPWGSRDRRGALPPTGWTWKDTVESGGWVGLTPQAVVIPAAYGFERGVWYKITEGVRGILVPGPDGGPRVYMVCEPSTRYYRVMTRSERMPWLVNEVI